MDTSPAKTANISPPHLPMQFVCHGEIDHPFFREREWLVTNGLGGYASGTLLGLPTRRYHGVFIPNLPAPYGRTVLIPRFDESVLIGDNIFHLTGAEFADGSIYGTPLVFLKEFRLEWLTPTWTFNIRSHLLQKRIIMPHGQNTVYIEYTLLDGPRLKLHLRPFITFRGHDDPLNTNKEGPLTLVVTPGRCEAAAFTGAPRLRMALRPDNGVFVVHDKKSPDVFYRIERRRGLDATETLESPGYFSVDLKKDEPIAFVASTDPWEFMEHAPSLIFETEQRRQEKLLSQAPAPLRQGLGAQLILAADQFIVLPGSRLQEQSLFSASEDPVRTVIAGYHWFTDWGRDTMISLEGLTLCTGRHDQARAILRTFSHYIHEGLLPNHFPEGQRTPLYNTIDATLWYFHAVDRYVEITNDKDTLRFLYPVLKTVIEHHIKGTLFGIGMDPKDSLLRGRAPGFALTWMDAKADEWVVTPRRGKPVEIQSLWYNALRLISLWTQELGESVDLYDETAHAVFESFNTRFWYEKGAYLYDVVDGDQGNDSALRPNQIFSIALRFPVLKQAHWEPVLKIVKETLLTPFGLRTLAASYPDYRPLYEGNRRERDGAYHQGMVWPWLIGAFADAWRKLYPDSAEMEEILEGFEHHLRDGCVGTISEIFDAEPPHLHRGCVAQAWSVAEVLRSILAQKTPNLQVIEGSRIDR